MLDPRFIFTHHFAPDKVEARLLQLSDDIPFINGFYYAREGLSWNAQHAA
jgi:hypothetical protein